MFLSEWHPLEKEGGVPVSSLHVQVAMKGPRNVSVKTPSSQGAASKMVPDGRTTQELVIPLIFS